MELLWYLTKSFFCVHTFTTEGVAQRVYKDTKMIETLSEVWNGVEVIILLGSWLDGLDLHVLIYLIVLQTSEYCLLNQMLLTIAIHRPNPD